MITLDIMDKAQSYIKANKITIYQKGRKQSASLAREIRKHHKNAQDTAVEQIANYALERVAKLMNVDYTIENFVASARADS